ncbi:MAG: DUF1353 domain-containing protein [Pseudomonadota bacterium]
MQGMLNRRQAALLLLAGPLAGHAARAQSDQEGERPENFGFFQGRLLIEADDRQSCPASDFDTGADYITRDTLVFFGPSYPPGGAGGDHPDRWEVPPDACLNGASIPWYVFDFIGNPWTNEYAKPAAVHDYHCEAQLRPWEDVHLAFYNALRASGVGRFRANLMYGAVYWRGPRWATTAELGAVAGPAVQTSLSQPPIYRSIGPEFAAFDFANASLAEIRAAEELRFSGERETRVLREGRAGAEIGSRRLQTLTPEMVADPALLSQ